MDNFDLQLQLVMLAASTPWLTVTLIAAGYCLWHLRDHPRKYWLVLAALAVSIGGLGSFNAFNLVMESIPGLIVPIWLLTVVMQILEAVCWGLFLYVAFSDDCQSNSTYLVEPGNDSKPA